MYCFKLTKIVYLLAWKNADNSGIWIGRLKWVNDAQLLDNRNGHQIMSNQFMLESSTGLLIYMLNVTRLTKLVHVNIVSKYLTNLTYLALIVYWLLSCVLCNYLRSYQMDMKKEPTRIVFCVNKCILTQFNWYTKEIFDEEIPSLDLYYKNYNCYHYAVIKCIENEFGPSHSCNKRRIIGNYTSVFLLACDQDCVHSVEKRHQDFSW